MSFGVKLYIQKIRRAAFARYQPSLVLAAKTCELAPIGSKKARAAQAAVKEYHELIDAQGCFHDDYYTTSVLRMLGYSWSSDVGRLCDAHRTLKGRALSTFYTMVRRAKLKLPSRQELKASGVRLTPRGKTSLAGWHDYFRQKHRELLTFLVAARKLKSPIYCEL